MMMLTGVRLASEEGMREGNKVHVEVGVGWFSITEYGDVCRTVKQLAINMFSIRSY